MNIPPKVLCDFKNEKHLVCYLLAAASIERKQEKNCCDFITLIVRHEDVLLLHISPVLHMHHISSKSTLMEDFSAGRMCVCVCHQATANGSVGPRGGGDRQHECSSIVSFVFFFYFILFFHAKQHNQFAQCMCL